VHRHFGNCLVFGDCFLAPLLYWEVLFPSKNALGYSVTSPRTNSHWVITVMNACNQREPRQAGAASWWETPALQGFGVPATEGMEPLAGPRLSQAHCEAEQAGVEGQVHLRFSEGVWWLQDLGRFFSCFFLILWNGKARVINGDVTHVARDWIQRPEKGSPWIRRIKGIMCLHISAELHFQEVTSQIAPLCCPAPPAQPEIHSSQTLHSCFGNSRLRQEEVLRDRLQKSTKLWHDP
jgi:hypothetical protein